MVTETAAHDVSSTANINDLRCDEVSISISLFYPEGL
jgi:hypothetical protein